MLRSCRRSIFGLTLGAFALVANLLLALVPVSAMASPGPGIAVVICSPDGPRTGQLGGGGPIGSPDRPVAEHCLDCPACSAHPTQAVFSGKQDTPVSFPWPSDRTSWHVLPDIALNPAIVFGRVQPRAPPVGL